MAQEGGRTLALTGATGFVGSHVLEQAAGSGWTIRALTRRPQAARPALQWVAGALDDQASLHTLCEGSDAVLHIAGVVNAPDRAGFDAGNVQGTANMLDAARSAGIGRFVHVSSLAANQPQLSAYGASKAAAEELVMASGLDWSIVRPPAIYGPRDTEMLELFRMARRGIVMLPPDIRARLSVIHAADLARLLLALLPTSDATRSAVFEVDDGKENGWEQAELAHAIGAAVGRKVRPVGTPRPLLGLAARLDGLLRGRGAKLTPDRVAYFCHPDWAIDAERRPPHSLWHPEIATVAGLKDTARWYREQGQL